MLNTENMTQHFQKSTQKPANKRSAIKQSVMILHLQSKQVVWFLTTRVN